MRELTKAEIKALKNAIAALKKAEAALSVFEIEELDATHGDLAQGVYDVTQIVRALERQLTKNS